MRKMLSYVLAVIALLAGFLLYSVFKIRLSPSISFPRPRLAAQDDALGLYQHVEKLSVDIGSRSVYDYAKIDRTKDYILSYLKALGHAPVLQSYEYKDRTYHNIVVTVVGSARADETVVLGAHYDTVANTPGADDNASGVAVLLELCRALKDFSPSRTLKFVFFALEEPPVFRTRSMGSYIYAADARARAEKIRAMICLEMVGYYGEKKGGQAFPLPFMGLIYSSTPNFIAVVGNLKSRHLVKRIRKTLEKGSDIQVETLSTVSFLPGVDFSDHRWFWKMGYEAVMITDTAFYRNPNYHGPNDTIDTLNFDKMSSLLEGLVQVAKDLSHPGQH